METSALAWMPAGRPRLSIPLALAGVITIVLMTCPSPCSDAQAERLSPQEEAAWIETLRGDIAARGLTLEVGPNPLTQIPWEEFQDQYLWLRMPEGYEPIPIIDDHGVNDRDLPVRYDWREHHPIDRGEWVPTSLAPAGAADQCHAFVPAQPQSSCFDDVELVSESRM